MNIFDKFYEPNEEILGLEDLKHKLEENKTKKEKILNLNNFDFKKVKFIPLFVDEDM